MELLEWERLGRSLWLYPQPVGFDRRTRAKYSLPLQTLHVGEERREKGVTDTEEREEGKKGSWQLGRGKGFDLVHPLAEKKEGE